MRICWRCECDPHTWRGWSFWHLLVFLPMNYFWKIFFFKDVGEGNDEIKTVKGW